MQTSATAGICRAFKQASPTGKSVEDSNFLLVSLFKSVHLTDGTTEPPTVADKVS